MTEIHFQMTEIHFVQSHIKAKKAWDLIHCIGVQQLVSAFFLPQLVLLYSLLQAHTYILCFYLVVGATFTIHNLYMIHVKRTGIC